MCFRPTTVLRPLYRSTCVSRHLQLRTESDFIGAKFYCPYALADVTLELRVNKRRYSVHFAFDLLPYATLLQLTIVPGGRRNSRVFVGSSVACQ